MLEGVWTGGHTNSHGVGLSSPPYLWSEIVKLISKVTGIFILLNIEQAIMSINMSEYRLSVRSIAMHILFAARSVMMSKWKTNEIPSSRELIMKVNIIAEFKKLLAYRDGSCSRYESDWSV